MHPEYRRARNAFKAAAAFLYALLLLLFIVLRLPYRAARAYILDALGYFVAIAKYIVRLSR